MQPLSITSILLVAITLSSIAALPLTSEIVEKTKETKSEKSNERQGRVYNAFGEASAARRGRFNRAISEIDTVSSEKTVGQSQGQKSVQVQQEKNERQGRVYNAFGSAGAARRGRFNRDVSRAELSIPGEKSAAPEDIKKVPEQKPGLEKQSERQGRVYNAFGSAGAARRGRFNRDVSRAETGEKTATSDDIKKTPEQKSGLEKQSERQGRVYNAFGSAGAARRGRFN